MKKIAKMLMPGRESSLSEKTVKGGLWLVLFRQSDQLLKFAKTLLLAALLLPSDFGIFGLATIALSFLDAFSHTGLNQALIQKKQEIASYLHTVWIIHVLRGAALYLLLFFSADWVAQFFNAPALALVIKVVSFSVVLQGLSSAALAHSLRELEFHKYYWYQFSGSIADFLVSVIAAVVLRSYWALVWGFLAAALVECLVSYWVFRYRPRMQFNIQKAKELLRFGKWVSGSNAIGFFMFQADSIFVGKVLGPVSLGLYQMAGKVASFLSADVISGALLPAYARAQDRLDALRGAYLASMRLACLVFLPATVGIWLVAPDFVKLFLGSAWLPSIVPLQILAWAGFFWILTVLSAPLLQAVGKPQVETFWVALRLVILVALIYPLLLAYGMAGAVWAVLAGSAAATAGFLLSAAKIVSVNTKTFFVVCLPSIAAAAFMVVWVQTIRWAMPQGWPEFLIATGGGALVYAAAVWVIDRRFSLGIINSLSGYLQRFRSTNS